MSNDSLRGLVQLVSGLGEMTVTRANQAARDLVSMSGMESQLGKKKLAKQVQATTRDLLEAAETNRTQLAALVRSEVEAALARADRARGLDADTARATTAALIGQVEDLANRVLALIPGLSDCSLVATAAPDPDAVVRSSGVDPAPARKRPARRTFSAAMGAQTSATPVEPQDPTPPSPAEMTAVKTTPATIAVKKAPAKKAPAKKAPAKKASAQKTAAKKIVRRTAKKAPAQKTAARKSSTNAPATKAAARTTSAQKRSAGPVARKASVTKATEPRSRNRRSTTPKATGR